MNLLLFDVEMALQLGYFYDQWNTNIPPHRIKHRGFMLSAAWQWYGNNKIHSVSLLDDPERFKKNHRDDYHVIKTLAEQVDKADAILAFNGDGFDVKELNTGLIKHGLPPTKSPITIDPYKIAKRYFRFKGGNSLRNICEFLGVESEKGKVDDETWIAAAEGCPKAIKKVVSYNKKDIPPMLEVYEKIKPFAPAKLNMNHFVPVDVCPSCGSPIIKFRGWTYTQTAKRRQYQCCDCNHRFRDKTSISTVNMR